MRWTCLYLLICPAVCLASDAADAGTPTTSADPALAPLDALWRERGDPAKAEEGIRQCQAALAAKPDDVDRMYRLARAELWVGDGLENNEDRKQKLGREQDEDVQEALAKVRKRIGDLGWDLVQERLTQDKPRTLEELGQRWGVSRERVRQVELKTKHFLARYLSALNQDEEQLDTPAEADAA